MNIIFLRGLPGSGKSSFVKEIRQKGLGVFDVVSKDSFMIKENGEYEYIKEREKEVDEKAISLFKSYLNDKKQNIIIDNLNLTEKSINTYLDLVDREVYKIIYATFKPRANEFHALNNTKGISENQIRLFKKIYKEIITGADYTITINDYATDEHISKLNKILTIEPRKARGVKEKSTKVKEKSTKAEIALRVAIVYEMVVKSVARKDIVRYGAKEWGLKSRQMDEYISKVHNQIKEQYDDNYRERVVSMHLAQLDDLYIKDYQIEDFRECRNIIESKNKLLGVYPADRVEHSGNLTFGHFLMSCDDDDED